MFRDVCLTGDNDPVCGCIAEIHIRSLKKKKMITVN